MAIYKLLHDKIQAIEPTTFAAIGIKERDDLQRLLRAQIEVLAPGAQYGPENPPYLVIAEEFSEWEDSKRRIDLLAIDKDANLVVIELKRTEDGGRMELQALRYAAMISTMTFERVVDVYSEFLKVNGSSANAEESILKFLDWDEPDEDRFAQDVRIILAGADFSKELTTTVLWLTERGIDIQCIRVKPYKGNDGTFLDVQQVIPLPEAEDYITKFKEKQQSERASRHAPKPKYNVAINGISQPSLPRVQAIKVVIKHLCNQGVTPEQIESCIPWRKNLFWKCEGQLTAEEFSTKCISGLPNGRHFNPSLYFTGSDELICAGGSTYALTRKWGPRTFKAINNLVAKFPEKGISCTGAN